jgi:AcrR family transcriptional regulator
VTPAHWAFTERGPARWLTTCKAKGYITDQLVIYTMSPASSRTHAASSADGASAAGHQRRKAERPTELLEAALALFSEKGFSATRAEEVAQRAGVSKGTLYLYYTSKEELLKAVIRNYLGNEISAVAVTVGQFEGSVSDGLRKLLADWWVKVLDSPASGVFKLMMAEMRNFPELAEFYRLEVVEPGERIIGSILQRGIDSGEFRPFDISVAVHSLLLPMVMICIHKHSLGACVTLEQLPDPAHFIRQHIELMLVGLQASPQAA